MNAAAVEVRAGSAPALSALQRLKSIVGGSIGNLVEYYDWYVYTSFSLYFAKSFFPQGDAVAQALSAAAVFAVGFLMRPIGGWYFGRYADRHGRRAWAEPRRSVQRHGRLHQPNDPARSDR